jgi:acylphosphatase
MSNPDVIRRHVYVEGRVQGVFFRSSLQERADQLGVAGYARNLPDGRVEAEFQGPESDVEQLVAFCREGPSYADVNDVEVTEREVEDGARGFRVG